MCAKGYPLTTERIIPNGKARRRCRHSHRRADRSPQEYGSDSPERTQWAPVRDDVPLAYSDTYFSPPLTSTSSSHLSPQSTCASFDNPLDAREMWSPGSGTAAGFFDTPHHAEFATSGGRGRHHAGPPVNMNWQYQANLQQPGGHVIQPPPSSTWMPQPAVSAATSSWSAQVSPALSLSSAPAQVGVHPREAGLAPDAFAPGRRHSPFASAGSSLGSTSPDLRLKSPRLKLEGSKSPPDSSPGNSESAATTTSKERRKKPRRKAHNAIEKRYRVKLNEKIAELRDSIPSLRTGPGLTTDGGYDHDSPADVSAPKINKAHILEKATEYVKELEASNRHLQEELYRERSRPGHPQFMTTGSAPVLSGRGQSLDGVAMVTGPTGGTVPHAWPYPYSHVAPDDASVLPQPGVRRR